MHKVFPNGYQVIEEELDVRKRKVEIGKVRITKSVREREELVNEPLLKEEVEVERVVIKRVSLAPVGLNERRLVASFCQPPHDSHKEMKSNG